MPKYGIVDTTFSRVDMGKIAYETIRREDPDGEIIRYTVPGIKDMPVGAAKLFERGCDGVITLGWVGKTKLDKYSYLATSIGLIQAQLMAKKHIMDVTVHEDEVEESKLLSLAKDRAAKHAVNLVKLVRDGGGSLSAMAGHGLRQGYNNAGQILSED
ncbi:MAG: riboflavin synthase [Candidatus Thermoplasmatota archaeon]|jgi:riboflavin synthase|nr:riboflavin synthase [Candidatus Thermoplasmatota archaeon]MCL5789314.1 riboflavin synthase [Candidatus Thermoplasmatota archaeon]